MTALATTQSGSIYDFIQDRCSNQGRNSEQLEAFMVELHSLFLQVITNETNGFSIEAYISLPGLPAHAGLVRMFLWADAIYRWVGTLAQSDREQLRHVQIVWE
jgi:hypothetical protein